MSANWDPGDKAYESTGANSCFDELAKRVPPVEVAIGKGRRR